MNALPTSNRKDTRIPNITENGNKTQVSDEGNSRIGVTTRGPGLREMIMGATGTSGITVKATTVKAVSTATGLTPDRVHFPGVAGSAENTNENTSPTAKTAKTMGQPVWAPNGARMKCAATGSEA